MLRITLTFFLALLLASRLDLDFLSVGQTGCQPSPGRGKHAGPSCPSSSFPLSLRASPGPRALWVPFLWLLVRGGSIRYTRTAELPLFLLWSFTSSISGSEFMAQRKLAFQVLGSGSFSPALYRPSGQERWRGSSGL